MATASSLPPGLSASASFTHAQLVERAGRWLRNTQKCSVVFSELYTFAGEVPDAIGWRASWSVLVECKTSKSDFYSDRRKTYRMGAEKFYLAPPNLIAVELVPEEWGLAEFDGRRVRIRKAPPQKDTRTIQAFRKEVRLLAAVARRAELRLPDRDLQKWIGTVRGNLTAAHP